MVAVAVGVPAGPAVAVIVEVPVRVDMNVKEASPLPSVVSVANFGDSPVVPVTVKVTTVLLTGFPWASRTVAVTV